MRSNSPAALEIPNVVPLSVDDGRTLLLLVDLQNEFCDPRGKLFLGRDAEAAVRASAVLLARGRRDGWRICWLRSVRAPDSVEFVAFGVMPHLLEGTWATEYTSPLFVGVHEKVVLKRTHDCFNATDLETWLAEQGIAGPNWTVLVVGVALPVCVDHAVMGLSVRGYRVGVLLDCVAPNQGCLAGATLCRYGMSAYSCNVVVSLSTLIRGVGRVGELAPVYPAPA